MWDLGSVAIMMIWRLGIWRCGGLENRGSWVLAVSGSAGDVGSCGSVNLVAAPQRTQASGGPAPGLKQLRRLTPALDNQAKSADL